MKIKTHLIPGMLRGGIWTPVLVPVLWICLACSHSVSVDSSLPSQSVHVQAMQTSPIAQSPASSPAESGKLRRQAFIMAAQKQGVLLGESQVAKMQDLLCEMDPNKFDAQKGFFAVTLNQMQELDRPQLPPHTPLKTLGPDSPELVPIFQAVRSKLCTGSA